MSLGASRDPPEIVIRYSGGELIRPLESYMQFWLSRIITVIVLSVVLCLNAARLNRKQLAWLDTAPPSKVVDFERRANSHGLIFHFIVGVFGGAEVLVVLELVSWGLRGMSQKRDEAVTASPDKTAVRPPE
jgi:hypothetical protein